MSQEYYRPTFIHINLQAIQANIQRLKKTLPTHTNIMAIIKANAYGHGDIEVAYAALAAGVTMLAVATPEEALRIREAGITAELLILGAAPASFLQAASTHNITLTAYSLEWLQTLKPTAHPVKVHIKMDSGMGRIGFAQEDELKEAISFIQQNDWLQITGTFTHFATADEESDVYFQKQVNKFGRFLSLLPEKPAIVHTASSAATLHFPTQHLDAVRFGISMYGIAPSHWMEENLPFPFEKALSLHTEVTHVKKVEKGTSIGYGTMYTAEKDEWIATLPIGYADGLLRKLHNQFVLIRGERMPIVGKICMDQCMVRLKEQVPIGEEVVLIGKQHSEEIRIEEWADALETIPYEVCCTLSSRIPRIYSK